MNISETAILIGVLLLLGLVSDEIGRRTMFPRVTVLMIWGVIVGKPGFDLLPAEFVAWFDFLSITALTMVSFLLGSSLSRKNLAEHGRTILWISSSIVLITIMVVAGGLWAMGMDPGLALILGAIAAATAPAATTDALRQARAEGPFADTVRGVVAIDDAWGLIAFSFIMVAAHMLSGTTDFSALIGGVWEIAGALGLAAAIGFPAARLTGRLRQGEPLEAEALGLVFLTAGLSLWMEVSFLVAGMTVGAIIVNFAAHHRRAFHEIEHLQWPFMILFFILAGASLELDAIVALGWIGAAYLVLRIVARLAGGWVGAGLGRAPAVHRRWFGIALLPQAGVAIGMALVAAEARPQDAAVIIGLTIGSTIFFELFGPAATIIAVRRVRALEKRSGHLGS